MARATFIKAARKSIYQRGKRVEYLSKKGKKEGQTLSKIDKTVPADDNDKILIAKGESYYTWSFMNGGTFYSKTRPRASQLTSSDFMSTYYGIQESVEDFETTDLDELISFVDDVKSSLEELRDETDDRLNNMPESLQGGPTGELLQERVDSLDSTISELEYIDFDFEEPSEEDSLAELAERNDVDTEEEGWKSKFSEEDIAEYVKSIKFDFVTEMLEKVKGLSFEL